MDACNEKRSTQDVWNEIFAQFDLLEPEDKDIILHDILVGIMNDRRDTLILAKKRVQAFQNLMIKIDEFASEKLNKK